MGKPSDFSDPTPSPTTASTGKSRLDTMPPMTLRGIVTKVGVMRKTATVTVSRWVVHEQTGKVRTALCQASGAFSPRSLTAN